MERKLRIALSMLMLLALMLQMMPMALATPSTAGCPKSPDGKHSWAPRPRDPWCEWSGGIVYVCAYCKKEAFEETTPALGHLWGEWTVTKKPTCSEQGSKRRTCNRCHKWEAQAIPTTGHSYSAWAVTVPPTCEGAGEQAHVCSNCGRTETKPAAPLGHNWDEGVITKKPTATEDGVMTFTCKNDPSHTKTKAIPATGETPPDETNPSLFISLACDEHIHSTGDNSIDWADFLLVYVTVKNTGNIPLKIKLPYGNEYVLQPDESYTYKNECKVKWSASGAGEHDDINYTPDDPLYYGDFTIKITVDGYDPDGIIEAPLCTSNEASLTIKFPREVEKHPSLHVSMKSDADTSYEESGDHWTRYVAIELSVTNTGDTPLLVNGRGCYDVLLMPEETYKTIIHEKIEDGGESIEGHDYITQTPDNPVYYGYITVTDTEYGYDPDAIMADPLCESNECSLTIWFPRFGVPDDDHPALSLNKTASSPENGEYFKQGEPIHWGLTVKNTTEAPITDVTVTDKGVNVGSFDSLAPNETQPCSVPEHIVTEYEAAVVGYVKNVAVANGKDQDGNESSWPSNEATALTKKPLEDGEDPLGPIYGLNVGVSLVKAEVPGPANGEYYQLNETINYTITVKNTGKEELKDLTITDSLEGFAAIGSIPSLSPGAEKTFNYSYTVQLGDIGHPWVVNSAILTYTFGDGISGTPRISTVYSKLNGIDPPGFDPDLLPRDGDYCSLTLNALGDSEARYTLHACTEHLPAAEAADAAAREGDWDKAVEIWREEIEKQYGILYEAGDSEAKSAVMAEKAFFDTYMDKYADAVNTEDAARMRQDTDRMYDMLLAAATGSRREALLREREQMYATIDAFGGTAKGMALAEALRLKCASLCCSIHTMPENRPDSLAGQYELLDNTDKYEANAREIADLEGSDSEVVERYDETSAQALRDTARMAAGAGNLAVAFRRGATLWQMALDDIMNPVYEAAAEERKQAIAVWRITLDSLLPAERALLAMMYGENQAVTEEQVMNLYKDAALYTEHVR